MNYFDSIYLIVQSFLTPSNLAGTALEVYTGVTVFAVALFGCWCVYKFVRRFF